MQVAVDQYLVNRHRQRTAKVLLALAPPFPLNVLPPEASHRHERYQTTPANSAAQYQSQISFTVTAGIRRGAFAGADVSCNTIVSVSPILRGRRSSNRVDSHS